MSKYRMEDGVSKTRECSKYHSGNHTLHQTVGGWWECAGCGHLYGEAKHAVHPIIPQPKSLAALAKARGEGL